MKLAAIILIFMCLLFSSCKKDAPSDTTLNQGYNYFPGEVGSYIIYEVDSIAYDDKSHAPDTTRYLLKEVFASTFTDNSGRPTLRLERFIKMYNDSIPYDSLNWTGPRVWYANITSNTVEKVEENIRYIKLVFPTKKGKEWDGNVYNTFSKKNYEIESADVLESINNLTFDSVATVKQNEQINIIEYIYEAEKYARNIGMIYKVRDSLYDGGTADTVGYSYRQKIVSYGK